jgi:hypothetical protein
VLSKALLEVLSNVLALTCLVAVLSDHGKHENDAAVLASCGTRVNRPEHRNTFFSLGVAKMNYDTHGKAMAAFRDAEGRQASPSPWEAYFDAQAN